MYRATVALLVTALVSLAGVMSPDAARGPSGAAAAADCAPPTVGGGVGEGQNDPLQFPPTVGDFRTVMLFVDFADVRGAESPQSLYEKLVPDAVRWYSNVSYARLRLAVIPLFRRVVLRGKVADYKVPGSGFGLARAAVEEAIEAADAEVDFSDVHAVYLVLPEAAATTIGPIGVLLLQPPVRVDDSDIRVRTVLFDTAAEPNYFAHETGHVLGLPDLYTRAGSHWWDIMASALNPRGFFAWHLWKLGWLDGDQIACLVGARRVEAVLTPLERAGGLKAIVDRRAGYAYVAEVRRPATLYGRVCKGGVLIYLVEFAARRPAAAIRLRRARYETQAESAKCGPQSAAPFGHGRGEISRVRAWGLLFEIRAALGDGSYRVRVTKTSGILLSR
jgi:M6 family metalloprotease-like protein